MDWSPHRTERKPLPSGSIDPRGSASVLPLRRHRDLHIIYNPTAGRRHRGLFPKTLRALVHRGCTVTVTETTGAGQATDYARKLRDARHDAVVVAGGDGTINEAINGLAGGATPVGLLPLGTANVLAREIGMTPGAGMIARTLALGPPTRIFLGRVESAEGIRLFSMMVGAGFDALVVARVSKRLKKWFGKAAYILQTLTEFVRYRPMTYTVTVDGESHEAASVIVANGHFYAGRYVCAPDARLDDDVLYACLFTRKGRWNALRYSLAMLMGHLPKLRDYLILPGRVVEVEGPKGSPVQADGDVVATLPVTVRMAGDTISLIYPGGRS